MLVPLGTADVASCFACFSRRVGVLAHRSAVAPAQDGGRVRPPYGNYAEAGERHDRMSRRSCCWGFAGPWGIRTPARTVAHPYLLCL
jgi:hypothetical protein